MVCRIVCRLLKLHRPDRNTPRRLQCVQMLCECTERLAIFCPRQPKSWVWNLPTFTIVQLQNDFWLCWDIQTAHLTFLQRRNIKVMQFFAGIRIDVIPFACAPCREQVHLKSVNARQFVRNRLPASHCHIDTYGLHLVRQFGLRFSRIRIAAHIQHDRQIDIIVVRDQFAIPRQTQQRARICKHLISNGCKLFRNGLQVSIDQRLIH